jgi:ABC-2 type transport system permease protein
MSANRAVVRALFFLRTRSAWNNLRVRLRRLRQPKYLIGAVVGLGYFLFYFGNVLLGPWRHARGVPDGLWNSSAAEPVFENIAAFGLLVWIFFNWVLPGSRAALAFTETELAFLLPAPLTRRTLIHYKLLSSQLALLITSAVFTVIGGRGLTDGTWVFRLLGWWLVFFTLNLHAMAASFTMTRLWDRGITPWRRRLVVIAFSALVLAGIGLWAARSIPGIPAGWDVDRLKDWLAQVVESGPVYGLLLPFRCLIGPWFARDWLAFLGALGPAVAIVVAHYVWVLRSEVAFEEASLVVARRTADIIARAKEGKNPLVTGRAKVRKPPFELKPVGFAPVALLWKNLIAISAGFNVRSGIFFLVWAVFVGVMISVALQSRGLAGAIGGVALMLVMLSMFLGPQLLRGDLRQDLPAMDVLKTFPLPGWQIVLGQMLAPAVMLSLFQWTMVAIAAGAFGNLDVRFGGVSSAERIVIAIAAALLLPGFNLIALTLPNALVLLFPAWVQVGREGPGGFEVMGQRLILGLGSVVVILLGLVPAGLVCGAVFGLLSWVGMGITAVLPAALAGLAVLVVEVGFAVVGLGRVFEAFDLSRE